MDQLFTPVISEEKLHDNFRRLLDDRYIHSKEVIAQWANGFVDRDGKFALEFQTTFNGCFWELYLFACLRELQYSVDFSYTSPDFVVSTPKGDFCIEATIASNADGTIPEWGTQIPEHLERDPELAIDLSTIRLANSISSKYKKYKDSYAILPHATGKPFVLAVAPFEQPFFYTQNQHAIRRVLYSYDKPIYEDFPERNTRVVYGHEYIEYILKPNGAPIHLGYFVKPEMTEISAVIFSNTATMGKADALSSDPGLLLFSALWYNKDGLYPRHEVLHKAEYKETLLDGLHVYHNPLAENPLAPDVLDFPGVIQYTYDFDNQLMKPIKEPETYLIQRFVARIVPIQE